MQIEMHLQNVDTELKHRIFIRGLLQYIYFIEMHPHTSTMKEKAKQKSVKSCSVVKCRKNAGNVHTFDCITINNFCINVLGLKPIKFKPLKQNTKRFTFRYCSLHKIPLSLSIMLID